MIETFLGWAIGHPGVLRWSGRAILSVCLALGLMGLRFDRVEARAARRGVAVPNLVDMLPAWMSWAVPETPPGWFCIVAVAIGGVALARLGRRLEKLG